MMTHDEMIAVIQAHKDGKAIQGYELHQWKDIKGTPKFNFDEFHYRVKPEPRVRWLILDRNGFAFTHGSISVHRDLHTVAIAHNFAKINGSFPPYSIVKFIEEV